MTRFLGVALLSFGLITFADTESGDQGSTVFYNASSCRAVILRKAQLCGINQDCLGVVFKNTSRCRRRDCKAMVFRRVGMCETDDCRGVLLKDEDYCETENCRAVIHLNPEMCR